jgi:hypothetical protein
MRCPGSLLAEEPMPNNSSSFADEGTAAHEFAGLFLSEEYTKEAAQALIDVLGVEVNGTVWPLTKDRFEPIWDYVRLVREYAKGGALYVENRVDFSNYLAQPDAFGTSDGIIVHEDEGRLTVIDLKFGMGERVDADWLDKGMKTRGNEQLMLYALGALYEYGWMADFKTVVMVISQPRLNHVSEYACSVQELLEFGEEAKAGAAAALDPDAPRVSGEKQCRWCKVKGTCQTLRADVLDAVSLELSDMPDVDADDLGSAMDMVDLVEDWAKGVREEAARRLSQGKPVTGFKLVTGRKGNRAWSNKDQAEAVLKRYRLRQNEIYDQSLISPTTAEKLLAEKFPKRWEKVQNLISRADGKPSVAPVTDKRPALVVKSVADELADL